MFDSTIRRSVATLGVVAGLLAAAVPASAAAPANADEQMNDNVKAVVVLIGANDYGFTEGDGQPIRDGVAQDTQASLGRENSIECLVRAEVSDERRAESRKPAPPGITLSHEGFEIQ